MLGPAKGTGNEMAQWILKANGKVIPRRSSPQSGWRHSPTEKKREIFNGFIERRWGISTTPPKPTSKNSDDNEFEEYKDDDEAKRVIPDMEDTVNINGKLLNQHAAYDKILLSEVSLQLGENMSDRKVTKRVLVGLDGTVAGTYDTNPCLNTMIYMKLNPLMGNSKNTQQMLLLISGF